MNNQIGGLVSRWADQINSLPLSWRSMSKNTRWLEHVRSLLITTTFCMTKVLEESTSLVIHCSDGWDRTAQIVSLVKLCLDPHYRTISGFQILIHSEWCAFGHLFRSRTGHSKERASYWENEDTSPVFMQFIDAVWQLIHQFPFSFEFTEAFLIALLDEVYEKRSTTFSFDQETDRLVCNSLYNI